MPDKISTDSDIMAAIVKNDEDQRAEIERLQTERDDLIREFGQFKAEQREFRSKMYAEVERLLHHRTEDARLLGAAQAEIERLQADNRGLTETIGEWQEIHGTFVANPEVERLRTALQEIREHCQYCCRDAQGMADEALRVKPTPSMGTADPKGDS